MRKNAQFIAVIFFVTLAFLIMLNDVTNNKNKEHQDTVEVYNNTDPSDIATTDLQDQE
ncbi:MAG: hypothetical protein KDD05_03400 [Psychroserpens sp.]|nr:hypothetical protein [Psychroserpens sp.]